MIKKFLLLMACLYACQSHTQAQYFPAGLPKTKINLWLDAADASTITSSGGSISRWTDKANGLQAIAPSASYNPTINNTLLGGKTLVEFQGVKTLNVADNDLLDPANGFNLAQVVYVHADASSSYSAATDFRVGTYSRNENPGAVPSYALMGTPSIAVRYVAGSNDNMYRVGLMRNNNSLLIGNGNTNFSDLSGQWHLMENYLTWTNSTDTTAVVQLNANAAVGSLYSYRNSANPLSIGNRYTNYASVHWSIGETILTGVPLRNAGKKILDVYLAHKWGLQNNLPTELQNLYAVPNTNFGNNMVGIGYESAIDSINGTGSNNGMGIQNIQSVAGFLREPGDYLLAGDNAATGITNIGTGFTRWNRVWFIDKTDNVGYGGQVQLYFDFNTYGIGNSLDTATNKFFLLYNANSSSFNSGTNYLIPVISYQQLVNTKQVSFLIDALQLNNGYYTIVYGSKNTPISNISLLGNMVPTTVTISPAPILQAVVAGNQFNYLFFNASNTGYSVAYYKIFQSQNNGSSYVLLDSTTNTFYAHYNLVNGNSYQYYVIAVYAPGKESNPSNSATAIPGIYAPIWETQPQYAGNGAVFMRAKSIGLGSPVKFLFQCIAGGGNSTSYQASHTYTDAGLVNGNTYTYRFKYMDSVKGLSTESGWSQPITVTLLDSAKGGFAYKFAFADNHSITVPFGVGPSNYVATNIDTTGLRFIKHAPAYGVHPRIYCNPEDSISIKWRFQNTASGKALAKYIHSITTLLQLGYGNGGTYSANANYAKDTLGNALLPNLGYASVKNLYDSLAAGDIGVINNYNNLWGGAALKMANILSYEAFECWLYKGTVDPVTNTAYAARASKLARAVSIWAQKALADNSNPLSFDQRDRFGSLQMALIYDFLYDQMTANQRDSVRMGLAAIAIRDSMDLHLVNSPSYSIVSNWATFGYEIFPLMAIEGEVGYTSKNETALQAYCRVVLNFLNYGFYEATGGPVEGIGKNQINVAMLTALAKRGYSLLGHPAVKAFAKKYYPAVLQPFGYSMVGTDLLGGTGYLNSFTNQYTSAQHGGWKHMLSLDILALKWVFPNDTTIDFLWKNYIQKTHASGVAAPYSYYYQNILNGSMGQATYWNFLFAAPFVSDYTATPYLTQAQTVYGNQKMYLDSLGGFAVLRSGFDTLSAALYYHNRTDLGGHTYGNKNDIVYSALGRIWIPRVYSNANSNAPLASGTSVQSSILINNIGQSVDTTTAQNLDILPVPGKLLQYKNTPSHQLVAGDAKDAYSYSWSYLFGGYTSDHPLLGGNYTKVMQTLNSYRYAKYYAFDDIPLYNKLTQGDYAWAAGARYYRTVATPWLHGVIQKAYRTVAMVTDAKPYVIVTDDVQKNNNTANYKWIAQLANDLVIDNIVVNLTDNNYRNDIIFREPSNTGNRRFLIRVLNNTGAVSNTLPAYVDSIQNPVNNLSPNNKLPRLVVESNSINPAFKILFFAFNQGDVLPITHWNAQHDAVQVNNNGTIKTILFPIDSAGRTNIQVMEGVLPLSLQLQGKWQTNQQVQLHWQAKDQANVHTYSVEAASNANDFITIGQLQALPQTNASYQWLPTNGYSYFRVKAQLKDGSYLYSNIVFMQAKQQSFQVFPNPMQHQLQLLTNQLHGWVQVQLTNTSGKLIWQKQLWITQGQLQALNLPAQLAKGNYIISLQQGQTKLSKLIVQQ